MCYIHCLLRIHPTRATPTQRLCQATHTGTFWEVPATGREVELSGVVVSKFGGERIIDQAFYWDLTASFFALYSRRRD